MYRRQENINQTQTHSQNQLPPIDFSSNKKAELFGTVAKAWSEKLNKESGKLVNKSSQIRQFYDKVLKLYEKSLNANDEEYKVKIYPFVVMLKSKAAYAKTRKKVSDTFVKMINTCVEKSQTRSDFETFKYFFEAVIGFYPKR